MNKDNQSYLVVFDGSLLISKLTRYYCTGYLAIFRTSLNYLGSTACQCSCGPNVIPVSNLIIHRLNLWNCAKHKVLREPILITEIFHASCETRHHHILLCPAYSSMDTACGCIAFVLASFPGPAQLFVACSTDKWESLVTFITWTWRIL